MLVVLIVTLSGSPGQISRGEHGGARELAFRIVAERVEGVCGGGVYDLNFTIHATAG